MERTKWIERTFAFDSPAGLLPNILERLKGTHVRLLEMTKNVSENEAAFKVESKWSIKEQIGHLIDLEDLHIFRLNELKERKSVLTAADMSNKKTEDTNHNASTLRTLIASFAEKRSQFVSILESMDDETQQHSATHTRLNVQMRPVDVAHFTAEHDDHHLASIRELLIS